MSTEFQESVFKAACRIPRGKVTSYSQIANAIGRPEAARAVGNALNKSPLMPRCPCHRVVRSDLSVGGYVSGTKAKIKLLRAEGVKIIGGRVDRDQFFPLK